MADGLRGKKPVLTDGHFDHMLLTGFAFLCCALVIFIAGMRLSYYGDIIAEKTGLGKAWIGLTLMAAVTSLPELGTGLSSVRIIGSADLAVGDVLGSCAFNLTLLALLDGFTINKSVFSQAAQGHIIAGALSIVLISLVGVGIVLNGQPILFGITGIITLLAMGVYFFSVRLLYRYEKKNSEHVLALCASPRYEDITLKKAVIRYALLAAAVVAAALALPHFAAEIAEASGLGESFVGTMLLAVVTSLPEAAVSIGALKLQLTSIAIGNLVGSNLFNMLILSIDDLFYEGNLLQDAGESHIITVFAVLIMTGIAITGFAYRGENKSFILGGDTLLIIAVYLSNMLLLYALR